MVEMSRDLYSHFGCLLTDVIRPRQFPLFIVYFLSVDLKIYGTILDLYPIFNFLFTLEYPERRTEVSPPPRVKTPSGRREEVKTYSRG